MKIYLFPLQNWVSGEYPNPECKSCSRRMLLAVQIYAPLDESPNHRTLYQFCCLNPKCQGKVESWVCLRDEVPDTSATYSLPKAKTSAKAVSTKASTQAWLDDADDWGDEENMDGDNGNSSNNNDRIETAIANLHINSLTTENLNSNTSENEATSSQTNLEHVPSAEVEGLEDSVMLDDLPTRPTVDIRAFFAPSAVNIPELAGIEFSSFYLNVIEEESADAFYDRKLDQRAKELWEEYQSREKCDLKTMQKSKGAPGRIDETYEKISPNHGDRFVHKFITQVQACPTQLIRYNREASPLLFKPLIKDDPKLLKCRHCNASLVFEMQLMPHLSQRLTLPDLDDSQVEFGTVIVYTCSASCWNGSPREEYLIVQSELY